MIGASINFAVVFGVGLLVIRLTSRKPREVGTDPTEEGASGPNRELVRIVTAGNCAVAGFISSLFALAYVSSFGHGDPLANRAFTVVGGTSLVVMAVCYVLVRRHFRRHGKEG